MDTIETASQFVTMGVGNEVFAVGVDSVREILDACHIVRLPNAPPFLLGLIDVRGQAVPVMDLRLKLGLPSAEVTENTRIVVLDVDTESGQLVLGMLADRVFEVAELDAGAVEPPPAIGVRWRSEYIRGIGRRGKDFVIVFDLPRLLSGEEAALIGQQAAA